MVPRVVFAMAQHKFQAGIRAVAALAACALAFHALPAAAEDGDRTALQKIKQSGAITVAFYKDYPPFSDDGKGIDVDLAEALAAKLGVKMSPVWFTAGEKVDDDLRKMVWKGTPLSSPADMLMHVPVDRQYMSRIEQVKVLGAYHRERFAMGRDLEKLPTIDNLEPFAKLQIGAEGESMGTLVVLSADGGKYRENLKLFKSADEAIAALKAGKVAAALGELGQLEAGLSGDSRFAVDTPPHPVLKMQQWVLGVAVKSDSEDLATALQAAMDQLMADGTVTRIMQSHGVKHRQP
jgi:ABC-type amino acid transport substrate-binding protein